MIFEIDFMKDKKTVVNLLTTYEHDNYYDNSLITVDGQGFSLDESYQKK